MESTTFTALAERAGRWWTVRIPQIEGLAVQVRSLDQAEMMARRHISEALRIPPESVRVELRTESSMLPAVAQALQARQVAVRAAEAAARATHAGLEALIADGATFQDAAIVLGLSPEEIAGFAPRVQAMSRPHAVRGNPAGHTLPSSPNAPTGPVSRGGAEASNGPATGPNGLPQRTRSPGSHPVHP